MDVIDHLDTMPADEVRHLALHSLDRRVRRAAQQELLGRPMAERQAARRAAVARAIARAAR